MAATRGAAPHGRRAGAASPSACLVLKLEQRQDVGSQRGLKHHIPTRASLKLHHRPQTTSAQAARMALLISDGQSLRMRACKS